MTDDRPVRRREPTGDETTRVFRPAVARDEERGDGAAEVSQAPEPRPRRPTVSDGREAPVRPRPDDARVERARHARQILSGAEVERPTRLSSSWAAPASPISESQRTYLISLGVLLLIGLILAFTVGFGIASIFFFLLALGLLGGWLAF